LIKSLSILSNLLSFGESIIPRTSTHNILHFMLVFLLFIGLFSPFLCFSFFIFLSFFSVWFFIALPCFSLLFQLFFVSVFRLLRVSSLAYPNLLGTKRLGCCCIIYYHSRVFPYCNSLKNNICQFKEYRGVIVSIFPFSTLFFMM
jgi:hypothetical protein